MVRTIRLVVKRIKVLGTPERPPCYKGIVVLDGNVFWEKESRDTSVYDEAVAFASGMKALAIYYFLCDATLDVADEEIEE